MEEMDVARRGANIKRQYIKARQKGRLRAIESNSARDVYNWLRKLYPNQNVVSESYLRLEKPAAATSTISFDVLSNEGNQSTTERRINIADDFVATHVGLAFIGAATADTEYGQYPLLGYPSTVNTNGADDPEIMNRIYNGYLSMRKDSIVVFDSIDINQFKYVGDSQQGVASAEASSWNRHVPMAPITPGLIMSGQAKQKLELSIPVDGALADIQVRIALLFRGFLVQGGASIK